jgi:hypothetical protein
MASETERKCLECGTPIHGRRDKKFCDDQCRNDHNNRLLSETSEEFKAINQILRKNRKILEELITPEGKTKIAGKVLAEKGFNFTYITHLYTTKTGSTYRYCYEYGYLPLEGDFFLIVKREKKMPGTPAESA